MLRGSPGCVFHINRPRLLSQGVIQGLSMSMQCGCAVTVAEWLELLASSAAELLRLTRVTGQQRVPDKRECLASKNCSFLLAAAAAAAAAARVLLLVNAYASGNNCRQCFEAQVAAVQAGHTSTHYIFRQHIRTAVELSCALPYTLSVTQTYINPDPSVCGQHRKRPHTARRACPQRVHS